MLSIKHAPYVLIILDGWGYRESEKYNAIRSADTPHWDRLWKNYPHTLISGSGAGVGLPPGQMGNSEVGHLNIGAGRVIYQDFSRIEHAIREGSFFKNAALTKAIQKAVDTNKAVHILGLLSPGGVHSHEQHIHALVDLAAQRGINKLYMHAFLDGRDTPPKSALQSLKNLDAKFNQAGCGQIASIIGRYYAMDRDQRWERVQSAYELLTQGKAQYHVNSAEEGLAQAYARDETDEFVTATAIHLPQQAPIVINDGDVVIFMNYRADRARELSRAFTEESFTGFNRAERPRLAHYVTLTQYAANLKADVAYPPQAVKNCLGEYLSTLGLRQFRIAETEKYAHVTFFFNGGIEAPFSGEDRELIPSPKIATYDLQPEMSAFKLTDQLVKAIESQQYALIVCNFANSDMVGHSGNFEATVKAIEALDVCLGRITASLEKVGGEAIITADHGNAECMYDEFLRQPHTAHTNEPVPFVYVGRRAAITVSDGILADIAPTLLYMMGLAQPVEMTGRVLLKLL